MNLRTISLKHEDKDYHDDCSAKDRERGRSRRELENRYLWPLEPWEETGGIIALTRGIITCHLSNTIYKSVGKACRTCKGRGSVPCPKQQDATIALQMEGLTKENN